jgi:hypothetical protein
MDKGFLSTETKNLKEKADLISQNISISDDNKNTMENIDSYSCIHTSLNLFLLWCGSWRRAKMSGWMP